MRKLLLVFMILSLSVPIFAIEHDYSANVANQNGNPSPIDIQTGSSVNQFTAGETNSRVDDYINQDDQVNVNTTDGTVKVLRTNQKINVNDYATAIVQFQYANPRELRHAFRTICRKEGGNADVIQDKVQQQFFMHVVCPDFQLPYLKAAAAALDEKWVQSINDGSGEIYYKGKFRNVADLWNGPLRLYKGPEGYANIDSNNNSIYFNDQAACVPLFKHGLEQMDIPPNQVALDVIVYELDQNNDTKLGLDYVAWKNGPGANLFGMVLANSNTENAYFNNPADIFDTDAISVTPKKFRYFGLNAIATSAYLDMLHAKGKAKVVTKGTLVTKSGRYAEIASVDEVLSIVAQQPENQNPNAYPGPIQIFVKYPSWCDTPAEQADYRAQLTAHYDSIYGAGNYNLVFTPEQWVNQNPQTAPRPIVNQKNANERIGFFMNALPYIGLESMELSLAVYVSSVTGITGNGTPIVSGRYAESTVRLKDGEPFVLAGLSRKDKIQSANKIPVLGDIPGLGWVFGGETNTNVEKDLVIVVVPKFILGADSDLEMPEEAKTVIAQVHGDEILQMPETCFGYDQWLLDCEECH